MLRLSKLLPRLTSLLAGLPGWAACLAVLAVMPLTAGDASGQDVRYTFLLREVALDEALGQFAVATGANIAYEPSLVDGQWIYCAIENATAQDALRCLLKGTTLDFYQLSSGTYVITRGPEEPPRYGQVAGIVLDRETRLPLPEAHVYLAEAGLGVSTNEAGLFVFPSLEAGAYPMRVSYVGYRSWRDTLYVAADTVARVKVGLARAPVVMEPVVIDGLQGLGPSETLGSGEVEGEVLLRSIPVLGASDVLSSVNLLSGVRLSEATADVHVQGGGAGEHQVRLDGSPVFLPQHLVGLVGAFSPFAIERVRIHKAGFGVDQGSQISGVVLLDHKLRKAGNRVLDVQVDPLSFNGRVSLEAQGRGDRQINVMAATRVGLWDWYQPGSLSRLLRNWSAPDPFLIEGPLSFFSTAQPTKVFPFVNPTLGFVDYHAAAQVRFGAMRRIGASYYRGRYQLETKDAPKHVDAFLEIRDNNDWLNETGQLRYETLLGARLLASVQLRESRYRMTHDYSLVDSLFILFGEEYEFDEGTAVPRTLVQIPVEDRNRIREVALETTLEYAVRSTHYLKAGLELMHTTSQFDLTAANGLAFFVSGCCIAPHQEVAHRHSSGRLAGYVEDRITLAKNVTAELGARFTRLSDRRDLFVEPRLALRYDRFSGKQPSWAVRIASGVYRQFLNQFDISNASIGVLMPSLRFWAPIDSTVRPPKAYHLAVDGMIQIRPTWTLRLETFAKWYPERLTFARKPAVSVLPWIAAPLSQQADFLEGGRGYAYGAALSLEQTADPIRFRGRVEWNRARQRRASRFGGRYEPVPWDEPFRAQIDVDWRMHRSLTVLFRWRGVWGRSHGFRPVYYDYFATDEFSRVYPPYDLSRPRMHRLPPLHQVDVSIIYMRRVGALRMQLRADVLNVLHRENVAEWRLRYDPIQGQFRTVPRTLVPFTPSVALRLSW